MQHWSSSNSATSASFHLALKINTIKHSMIMWICPSIPGLAFWCILFFYHLLPSFQTSKYPKASQSMECLRYISNFLQQVTVATVVQLWVCHGSSSCGSSLVFTWQMEMIPKIHQRGEHWNVSPPLSIRSGIWNIMAGYWWYWSSEWDCNRGNKCHVMSLQDKDMNRHRQGRIFSVKTSG